jgi:hypothetical protein
MYVDVSEVGEDCLRERDWDAWHGDQPEHREPVSIMCTRR